MMFKLQSCPTQLSLGASCCAKHEIQSLLLLCLQAPSRQGDGGRPWGIYNKKYIEKPFGESQRNPEWLAHAVPKVTWQSRLSLFVRIGGAAARLLSTIHRHAGLRGLFYQTIRCSTTFKVGAPSSTYLLAPLILQAAKWSDPTRPAALLALDPRLYRTVTQSLYPHMELPPEARFTISMG